MRHYRRIACLCTEAVETMYALAAQDTIAGISGLATRPARACREKPKISGFSSSKIERILAPGPAAITEGLTQIEALIARWYGQQRQQLESA